MEKVGQDRIEDYALFLSKTGDKSLKTSYTEVAGALLFFFYILYLFFLKKFKF